MRKISKSELRKRVEELERENGVQFLALNDIAKGNVRIFKQGKAKLAVSRPNGAQGGIVILWTNGYVSAHYWEEWFPKIKELIPTSDEDLNWRNVAYQAEAHILNSQAAK